MMVSCIGAPGVIGWTWTAGPHALGGKGCDLTSHLPLAPAGALATPTTLGHPAAALMCDLDHFKRINDRLGHEFGDAALRHVANVLREAARQDDIVVARMGGKEFALLLTDVMRADAFVFADKLRMSIAARPVEWAGAKATITMSIGFAATPSWQGQVSPLLARADAALYEAKRGGAKPRRIGAGISRRDGVNAILDFGTRLSEKSLDRMSAGV